MNIVIAYTTLTILVLLVWRQIKVWRTRVLLSPGFYFGALWTLGVFGSTVFFGLELIPTRFPQYINELNILVGFSGLCFLFITPVGRSKINTDAIDVDFTSKRVFKILSLLSLLAAMYEFARTGFNLNMGAAREDMHDIIDGRPSWVGYLSMAVVPLSIWAGSKIIHIIMSKTRVSIVDAFFLSVPLVANLIFSITVGGRVDFVYCFVNYLIGMSFALPINKSLKEIKKPLLLMFASLLVVMVFITAVAKQRTENSTGQMSEMQEAFEDMYPKAKFMYGPVAYMTETYVGYQYRRDDAVDLKHLGYGRYTFNGFINWTLPFAGAFGMADKSIANALGIYYNNQETYDFQRDFYYVTHSGYIPMVKDFGVMGSLFCIVFLVIVAHLLFVGIQRRRSIKRATVLFVFMMFLFYWLKMNYYGTLSASVIVGLYGYLIVDIFNIFINPLTFKRSDYGN